MSFSREVKEELTRAEPADRAAAAAECYGMLLFRNVFTANLIKVAAGIPEIEELIPRLFRKAFGIKPEAGHERNGRAYFSVNGDAELDRIFSCLGCSRFAFTAAHINLGVLEEKNCQEAFVRGAFLSGGSVTDPSKRYHLELVTSHYGVNRELAALLFDMGFDAGTAERRGNFVSYFKRGAAIEDFLTVIGAPVSAMKVMSARIDKSMTNVVNRKVNCDTANIYKTVVASEAQINAIRRLRERGEMESLPQALYAAAVLREQNPELSLTELAAASDPPVSKSGLNHRLRRLIELANQDSRENNG